MGDGAKVSLQWTRLKVMRTGVRECRLQHCDNIEVPILFVVNSSDARQD